MKIFSDLKVFFLRIYCRMTILKQFIVNNKLKNMLSDETINKKTIFN